MLKNILAAFLCVFIFAVAGHSQGLIITPSDTLVLDTSVNNQTELVMSFEMKNNTTSDSVFKWTLIYNTFPHCWEMGFCDPHLCRAPIPSGVFTYNLSPGASAPMQLDLTDTCASACGKVQILTWAVGDSANTAVYLNYSACFSVFPAGITTIGASQISIYPNPVKNQLNVSLPQTLENGQMDIFSILGTKVYSQSIGSNETSKEADVSSLEPGLYIARISDGGHVLATRKFTKED